jgi:dienelactone hydrolase
VSRSATPRRPFRMRAFAALTLALSLGACQSQGGATTDAPAIPIATVAAPTVARTPLPAASWAALDVAQAESGARRVAFKASDGVELDGRMFGTGDVAVVLSHMGDPANNQSDWYGFAAALAAHGYRAITYDSRGICPGGVAGCSKGSITDPTRRNDVLGAIRFARAQGAKRVIVMGASLGATASLQAVLEPGNGADGLVWIAGSLFSSWSGVSFGKEQIAAIAVPTLVIVADHDPLGVVLDSQKLFDELTGEKRLVMPSAQLHGTDMLQPGVDPIVGGQVLEAVLEFLARE